MYRPEDTNLNGGSHERDETMLDAALEELLSGEGPPDMAGRILRAHAAGRVAVDGGAIPLALPIAPPLAEPPLVSIAPPVPWGSPSGRVSKAPRRQHATVISQPWTGMLVAASVLVAGVAIGLLALSASGRLNEGDNVAQVAAPTAREQNSTAKREEPRGQPLAQAAPPIDDPFDHVPFGAEDLTAGLDRGVPWQVPYAIEPQPRERIVSFVNDELARSWRAAGVQPSTAIDDAAWAERVTRQLLGRAPSAEEVAQFERDRSPQKREALVQRLLSDEPYRSEFARHWAKNWADELVGRSALEHWQGLRFYLATALASDKPFNQITHELLTATGSSDPSAPDFNPATHFVLSGVDGKREAIAGTVSRALLGHQGQCAQCHDAKSMNSKGDGLSQQQFWQLAAFFQQVKPVREASGATRLVDADVVGPTGDIDEAELFYDRPDRQRKIAYPVFVDGQAISPSGRVAEVNRREELARLVVQSEDFSRAIVDGWWSQLMGRELASSANSPHAELRQRLAEQFAAHGFDHRQLVAWIVLSQANQREAAGEVDPRFIASAPLFEQFYGDDRSIGPYDSFASALEAAQRGARPLAAARSSIVARIAAVQPSDDGDASIIARSAASLSRPAQVDAPASAFVEGIIASDMTFADKVKHLFLSGTSRAPTLAQQQAAQQTLARYEGNVGGALRELWWAIENSGDFRPAR